MKNIGLSLMVLTLLSATALAANVKEYSSDYAGQEKRRIKSLSPDDIEQLLAGKGWGLAKAAELNGMPGPVHILQMKKEIALTAVQESKIQSLYDEMKKQAIPLGRELVELEKELNDAFADKSINSETLMSRLGKIADVRRQLRYVHLAAHLKTPDILSADQISQYNRLRGYDSADPCKNIPYGHDAEMWKKHNGCQ